MENRRYKRVTITNLSIDASDGIGFFKGMIFDISRIGFRVTDISNKIDSKVKRLTVVVSGQGQNFKMNVKPKWATYNGASKSMGVEISNAPWGWTEFVMNNEPEEENDVWSAVSL